MMGTGASGRAQLVLLSPVQCQATWPLFCAHEIVHRSHALFMKQRLACAWQALSRTVEMASTISRLTEESEAKLQRFGDRQAASDLTNAVCT